MSTHLSASNNKLPSGQGSVDTQWLVHGFTETETQSDPDINTVNRVTNQLKRHVGGHTGE